MDRELNPPDEIFRRLLYILYLGLVTAALLLGVLALARTRYDYLFVAGLLGLAGFLLRRFGRRRLEFARLAASFPYDGQAGGLSGRQRREVERLLQESVRQGIGWVERQELRQRLTALLEEEPRLWQAYHREILDIFPALAATMEHRPGQN